ncbi:MAG TPA: NHL repeat-containing protein [Candidatus Paceibacterota bacterium]|nr:NHL repeat-containing protein [Verrucomicrobiota bacterium]HSA11565.1 NHL repeat-containing protein [Candidatus Paceibacterota bacterium]
MCRFTQHLGVTVSRSLALLALVLGSASGLGADNAVYLWRTFAGQPGSWGTNDGAGGAARFYYPGGVAADGAGNLFVADTINHTIRKVTSAGAVTTLAGSAGNAGTNDGTGSAARFWYPSGVAVDGTGNVYVADQGSHTIRRITSGGAVSTLAGLGGNSGTNDGTGSAARFSSPSGVAVDGAGTVYVADYFNHTIRQVTSAGIVTTLAGWAGQSGTNDSQGTAARFSLPSSVAVDTDGNVFVADFGNHTVRMITSGGIVSTLAGLAGNPGSDDGPGGSARFYYPQGVAVDAAGNVLVADRFNHTIRKVTGAGAVTTLGGSAELSGTNDGPGNAARFNLPYGVAADSAGNVYVADTYNHRISKGISLPVLAIRQSGNSSIVFWPSPSASFVLEENSDPANATGWVTCGYPIADDGTNKSITITSPTDNQFFRLVSD